jgi:DNA replication and repair protein RecF
MILTRRNKVLARILEGKSRPTELDFWDSRLLEHGKYIVKKREEFFEFLNFLESVLPGGKKEELSWQLRQSVINPEKLLKNRERDVAAGMTLSGPHRDDFRFIYKNKDLLYFGSRGEQRMAVLALKLAELEYCHVKRGSRPILALDDIFSELDWEHREAVIAAVGKQQTIITAAEADSVPKQLLKRARIIELE